MVASAQLDFEACQAGAQHRAGVAASDRIADPVPVAVDPASVLIYGSCVARDTYELVKDERPLAAYVARQSLISALAPATEVRLGAPLESAFQQRMLEGDLRSSLLTTVRQYARSTGLFLIDLVDERGGVYRVDAGGWVTNTAELKRSGLLNHTAHSRLVAFGVDRHFQLWNRAWERFVPQLHRYGLADRTVVIEAPFAAVTVEGDVLPPFGGVTADGWNAAYERYYGVVRDAGITTVRIPDEFVRSTRGHRWHPDPYHYIDDAYRFLLGALQARGFLRNGPTVT